MSFVMSPVSAYQFHAAQARVLRGMNETSEWMMTGFSQNLNAPRTARSSGVASGSIASDSGACEARMTAS